jgi:hypothetical protein
MHLELHPPIIRWVPLQVGQKIHLGALEKNTQVGQGGLGRLRGDTEHAERHTARQPDFRL